MVRFNGKRISKADKETLKDFTKFVLDKFISKQKQSNIKITIKLLSEATAKESDKKDLKEFKAWVSYSDNYPNNFFIIINTKMIKTSAKKPLTRLKEAMLCLGHELVHIKQYVNGEIKDYANDDVGYNGQRYKDWEDNEEYWFSPWELEAYSYELGLFSVYEIKRKNKNGSH